MEDDDYYSATLGNLNGKGQIRIFKPTGNGDAKKVLATVANIIEFFMRKKPRAVIFMTGTSKKLTDLYKKLLFRELRLSVGRVAEGVLKNNVCEAIDPNKDYEGYFVYQEIEVVFTL